jgi:hypothetical protein
MAPLIMHDFHDLGCVWRENGRLFGMCLVGVWEAGLCNLSELKQNEPLFHGFFCTVAVEIKSCTINIHRFIGECRKGGACLLVGIPPTMSWEELKNGQF